MAKILNRSIKILLACLCIAFWQFSGFAHNPDHSTGGESYTRTASTDCEGCTFGNPFEVSKVVNFDDNTGPTITCPSVTTPIECPATPSFGDATASSNCGSDVTVTYIDVTTPGACPQEYSVTRTWTATDDCGSNSCSRTITVEDNTPPSISCPANVTADCESDIPPVLSSFPAGVVSDNCDTDVTITSDPGTLSGGPCGGTITRIYTATDDCGNSKSCIQTITIDDNIPPSITCPADVTLSCGESIDPSNTGTPTGSDNCGGSVDFTYTDSPDPSTVCGTETGGTFVRTWTATDVCGNTATCAQTISCGPPCPVICSLTQGFYGGGGSYTYEGISYTATELIELALTNSGPMVLGAAGHQLTVETSGAACLHDLLPAGGNGKIFPGELIIDGSCNVPGNWTKNDKFVSTLWGQAITLWLNAKLFTEFCELDLDNACVSRPAFIPGSVITVCDLIDYASAAVGGTPGLNGGQLGQLTTYLGNLNLYFDECNYACVPVQPIAPPNNFFSGKVNGTKVQDDFSVVPNPMWNDFIVTVNPENVGKPLTIRVINQFGQLLLQESYNALPNDQISMSAATLSPGIYQILVLFENSRPISKTVVVARR